jgi:hypothetical protein
MPKKCSACSSMRSLYARTVTFSCIEGFEKKNTCHKGLPHADDVWYVTVTHFFTSKVKVTPAVRRFTFLQLEFKGAHIHVRTVTLSCIEDFKT